MYIIHNDHVFNTDRFGAIKFEERNITFYTPDSCGSDNGKAPEFSEDNSIFFFREDNAQRAHKEIVDSLCKGNCIAVRLEEKFGLPGVEKTKEPGLLVEKFYTKSKRSSGRETCRPAEKE